MEQVGVDGAIFISAFSMYRYDASYAVDVQRAILGRLAIAALRTRTILRGDVVADEEDAGPVGSGYV